MEITLSEEEYRSKVCGGWLGKNIGGTLGMPFEGELGTHKLTFYEPIPKEPVGNDDLDMQLVWLHTLLEKGIDINEYDLRRSWLDHIKNPFMDEYNKCYINMKKGLLPPVCGWYNNVFSDCMGASIRSEIWAMICPGCPSKAVVYAYNDAVLDHRNEGIYGEVFLSALESAAFCEKDIDKIIGIAIKFIPPESQVRWVVECVRDKYEKGIDWKDAREVLVRKFNTTNACFTPINIGFMIIGLLYGTDFGTRLCTAVNCGYDTDCTGATVGAILGIINGENKIPQDWKRPIGSAIKTDLSLIGFDVPSDVSKLTEDTMRVGYKVLKRLRPKDYFVRLEYHDIIFNKVSFSPQKKFDLYEKGHDLVIIPFDCGNIHVKYNGQPTIGYGEEKTLDVAIRLKDKFKMAKGLSIHVPNGWHVDVLKTNKVDISPGINYKVKIRVKDSGGTISTSNTLRLKFEILKKGDRHIDIAILGKAVWFVSAPKTIMTEGDFETVYDEETNLRLKKGSPGVYLVQIDDESLSPLFRTHTRCVVYAQTSVFFPVGRNVKVFADCNDAVTLWFKGKKILSVHKHDELLPSAHRMRTPGVVIKVKKGWNKFFLKLLSNRDDYNGYFFLAKPPRNYMGFTDIRYDALERGR